MLNSRTITNVTLIIIAVVLLVAVAQGGLAQLSSLFSGATVEQTPANTNSPPNSGGAVNSVPPLSFLDRLLIYAFLIWALALGVEAGVEVIRLIFHVRLYTEPGPTQILNDLNPWLPSSGAISEKHEPEAGPSPQDTGAGHANEPASGTDPAPLEGRAKALQGIAMNMNIRNAMKRKETIRNIEDWPGIFQVFALKQREYLENKAGYLRFYRAISLVLAIVFAFVTGVNSFTILFGSDIEGQKAFSQLFSTAIDTFWYTVGGILLSAFAATAGSAVWHDLLDKLRQSKEPEAPPGQAGPQPGQPGSQ